MYLSSGALLSKVIKVILFSLVAAIILFSLATFILFAQFDRGHVGPENMFLLGSPLRCPLHTAADPLQLKLQPFRSLYGKKSFLVKTIHD